MQLSDRGMPDTVLNTSVRGNADVRSMAPHSSDSTTNQSTSEVGRRTKTVIPAGIDERNPDFVIIFDDLATVYTSFS